MFTKEEDDFVLRQVKKLAEGLGQFLGKKSFYELLGEEQKQQLPENRLEDFFDLLALEKLRTENKKSIAFLAQKVSLKEEELLALFQMKRLPTLEESEKISRFLQKEGLK